MSSKATDNRSRDAAMLEMLRGARALVLRDAESFDAAAAALEHIGQMLCGEVRNGLAWYRKEICGIAKPALDVQRDRLGPLFDVVLSARNDSVHSGSYIRHHAGRLVELLLILEEGLSMSAMTAGDLMVRSPTTAELWQTVGTARRAMLGNSFSFLPMQGKDGEWKLLSDASIAQYLAEPAGRKRRLGTPLVEAIEGRGVKLTDCKRLSALDAIDRAKRSVSHVPFLIVDRVGGEERLMGILSAFDLL